MFFGLGFALGALVVDQASKWYVAGLFRQGMPPKAFGPYFNLVEAWNPGVSFSLFDDGGFWGSVLLTVFALGVVAYLLYWLHRESDRLVQAALGLVIGGALGNVADRIRFGAVYDFLDFHYNEWHWPAFNAADAFICLGAFLIVFRSISLRKKISLKEIAK